MVEINPSANVPAVQVRLSDWLSSRKQFKDSSCCEWKARIQVWENIRRYRHPLVLRANILSLILRWLIIIYGKVIAILTY